MIAQALSGVDFTRYEVNLAFLKSLQKWPYTCSLTHAEDRPPFWGLPDELASILWHDGLYELIQPTA